MPSLYEVASSPGTQEQMGSGMGAYRAYVLACQEAGKPHLSYQEWVKAGRPAGG